MAQLRVDHFPKNGKTSPNPKLPSITAKENPRTGAGKDMPRQFNTKPALATANTMGQGHKVPKFGIADKGTTYAKGGNVSGAPKGSNMSKSGTTAPGSHDAFMALGNPKGNKY
jgi:hypothetical protein